MAAAVVRTTAARAVVARLVGWVLTILGPVIGIAGIVAALSVEARVPAAVAWHSALAVIGVVLVIAVTVSFLKTPFIRLAWKRGGFARGIILAHYGGMVAFFAGFAFASLRLLAIGWSAGALAVVVFVVAEPWQEPRPEGSSTARDSLRAADGK